MNKTIFTNVEKCVGCKGCEIACAVSHSQSGDLVTAMTEIPAPMPRVRIQAAGAYTYPSRCQHCGDAACISACPTGAMARRADTGAVAVDQGKCIGCWMCVTVCPFGGVTANPATHTAHKCDLCPERTAAGQDPACVAACPTQAMIFASPEEIAEERRRITAFSAIGAVARTSGPGEAWRSLRGGVRS